MPKLTKADINQIGQNMVSTMAPIFYGTELGNHIYEAGKKLITISESIGDRSKNKNNILEEDLREFGFDKVVTDTLKVLNDEKKKGNYAEGSIQGVALDYMIWESENMLRRQSYRKNEAMINQPAYTAMAKWANTRTVPKYSAKENENINANENLKNDVTEHGKYSIDEIDKSFKNSNMNNFMISGMKYIDSSNKAKEIIKNGSVDEEQLRQQLISDGEKFVQETNKLIEELRNPTKEHTLKIFDDGKLVGDFALEGKRSLSYDISKINRDINYLKKGHSLAGLAVYQAADIELRTLEERVNSPAFRALENGEAFQKSINDLRDIMNNIPDGNDDMMCSLWGQEIDERIKNVQSEYKKLADNPVFKKDENGEELSEALKKQYLNDIKEDKEFLGAMEKLNKHSFGRNNYLSLTGKKEDNRKSKEYVDDLEAQRILIGKELKALKKEVKNIPGSLKKAVDKVIKECEPDNNSSLKTLQESLKALSKEAKKYEAREDQKKEIEKLSLYNKVKDNFDYIIRGCHDKQIADYLDSYNRANCASIDRQEMKKKLLEFKKADQAKGIVQKIDVVINAIDKNENAEKFANAVVTLKAKANEDLVLVESSALDDDPDSLAYIEKYAYDYKVDVNKAKNQDKTVKFADYMSNTMPFINAKVKDATERGVIYTDSIKKQSELIARNGQDRMEDALNKFNKKRSGIFGKGNHYSKEYGKESNEHYNLRVAAQELKAEKDKLSGISRKDRPEEWKAQAEIVYGKARDVVATGKIYLDKVGYAANTGAGFSRMEGAMDLRREASLISTQIKREYNIFNMQEKFAKLAENKVNAKQNAAGPEANVKNEAQKEADVKVKSFKDVENKFKPAKEENKVDVKRTSSQKSMSVNGPMVS